MKDRTTIFLIGTILPLSSSWTRLSASTIDELLRRN
jgi:hypothetical protein